MKRGPGNREYSGRADHPCEDPEVEGAWRAEGRQGIRQ